MKGWRTISLRFCLSTIGIWMAFNLHAQETVFSMIKSDERKANEFYEAGNYRQAIKIYESMVARNPKQAYLLNLARAYYFLNEPENAVNWYGRIISLNPELPLKDNYLYAESLASTKDYDNALEYYSIYHKMENDPVVMKKIWQLKNRNYLFEDSIHYTIKRLDTNSPASDISGVAYGNGYVFLSNRKRKTVIDKVDASNVPFFRLYSATVETDSTGIVEKYGSSVDFFTELNSKFQVGPVSFYNHQQQMAFIASGNPSEARNKRSLQLYFAGLEADVWRVKSAFVFNNAETSYTAVTISEDGNVLYLASDMPGGLGGLDLYKSMMVNGSWTKPKNLGEQINTSGHESYPSVVGNTLYFASTGHAGLGGFDVFTVPISDDAFGDVQNMGYPINTNADDFALSLNSDKSSGFLTSNRNNSDDVYEITVDLQSYPFIIAGSLKYKEDGWSDTRDLKIFPYAQLELIDNLKSTVVGRTTSDANGSFSLTIPYFSQYRIKIVSDAAEDEAYISLDLGKTRYGENQFELVVVKNSFKKAY